MTVATIFVDTNVLLYAFDKSAGRKCAVADARLRSLWAENSGVLSLQVLNEFFFNAVRKLSDRGIPWARDIVREYSAWLGKPATIDTSLRAMELMESARLSFWDALVVASAAENGATVLLSEDMQHGQIIAGVRIENPFRDVQ